MKLIKQGAEAKLFLANLHGKDVIIKNRVEKRYRIKQLDSRIRKSRTSLESNLLSAARRVGVPTPQILDIDKDDFSIIMEYINGIRVKELLNECDEKKLKEVSIQVGRLIGKLHSAGIIHGDLTTSNMIMKDGKLYFIDFGLGFFSRKLEDQGTDLKLLKEALKSTHFKIMDVCWKNILKGYRTEYPKAEMVLKRVEDIEKRARYKQR